MANTSKNGEKRITRMELYHSRTANHECPVCGKKLSETYKFTHCEACREQLKARQKLVDAVKLNEKRRERYAERKKSHLCPRCGAAVPENSTEYLCAECLDYARITNQKKAEKKEGVMPKKSVKKAAVPKPVIKSESAEAKQKRGRPSKAVPAAAESAEVKQKRGKPSKAAPVAAESAEVKQKRGRPSKATPSAAENAEVKQKRGRPSKAASVTAESASVKQKRGRPSKTTPVAAESAEVKQKRGRPSKVAPVIAESAEVKQKRGRPSKAVPVAAESAEVKQKHGRPAKVATVAAESADVKQKRGKGRGNKQ